MHYDANEGPDPGIWSSLEHTERIDLVAAYHREVQLPGDGDELHIAVHVAIEDHLARGPTEVSWMITRLVDDGLTRHDAIHAIGDVLLSILGEVVGKAAVTSQRELASNTAASRRFSKSI
jgi:hypothetical protein